MIPGQDGRSYADAYAGREVRVIPIDPAHKPFRATVVGWYYGNVLVEPVSEKDVPEGLRALLRDCMDYNLANYNIMPNGKVMPVPVHTLRAASGTGRYPHECPRCGGAAYVGAVPASVDCSRGCDFKR